MNRPGQGVELGGDGVDEAAQARHLAADLAAEAERVAAAAVEAGAHVGLAVAAAVQLGADGDDLAPDVGDAPLVGAAEVAVVGGARHQLAELALQALGLGADGAQVELDRHAGQGVGARRQPRIVVAGAAVTTTACGDARPRGGAAGTERRRWVIAPQGGQGVVMGGTGGRGLAAAALRRDGGCGSGSRRQVKTCPDRGGQVGARPGADASFSASSPAARKRGGRVGPAG